MIIPSRTSFLLMLCLFLFAVPVFTQNKHFQRGTITLSNGTVLQGFLERNTFQNTGKGILFQANANTIPKVYLPDQLKEFTYEKGNITFRSVTFEFYDYEDGQKTKNNTARRFAQVLSTGAVDLLKVPLQADEYEKAVYGSRDYLYLIQTEEEVVQIDLLRSKISGNHEVVSEHYKGMLAYALKDCTSISTLTQRVTFSDKSMRQLIEKYHDCIGQKDKLLVVEDNQKNIIEHQIRGGYIFVRDDFFEDETGYSFGYQVHVRLPNLSRNIGFSFATELVHTSYFWNDGFFFRGDYKELDLRINLGVDIYLMQKEQFQLRVTPGYNYFLMLNQNPDVTAQGVGNYQLFALELSAQYRNFGVFAQTAGQGGNVARPDGMLNLGLTYRFK